MIYQRASGVVPLLVRRGGAGRLGASVEPLAWGRLDVLRRGGPRTSKTNTSQYDGGGCTLATGNATLTTAYRPPATPPGPLEPLAGTLPSPMRPGPGRSPPIKQYDTSLYSISESTYYVHRSLHCIKYDSKLTCSRLFPFIRPKFLSNCPLLNELCSAVFLLFSPPRLLPLL